MWPFRNQNAPRTVDTRNWNGVAKQNMENLAQSYGAKVVQHNGKTVILPGGSDEHKKCLHQMIDRYENT